MRLCPSIMTAVAVTAALGLLQGCASPERRAALAASDQLSAARIAGQFRDIALRAGVGQCVSRLELPPAFGRRCYVTVDVTPYTGSNGTEYCVAKLPESIEFSDRNVRKVIVFELNPATVGNVRYEFHEDAGILLFTNALGDVTKGGHGNGTGLFNKAQYHVRNLHTQKADAFYLPVILKYDGSSSQPVSVCAAVDPKIVNN